MLHHDVPRSLPNPVWFGTGRTGIFHADPQCPAIRREMDPTWAFRMIYELDRATGTAWAWQQGVEKGMEVGWVKIADNMNHPAFRYDSPSETVVLSDWRACLRCGSMRSDGTYRAKTSGPQRDVPPCPNCHLTPCCCD